MKSGFVKISRDILSWHWYQNLHTKGLYLYLLMNTAWKPYTDTVTQKHVSRGQCLFSLRRAAQETGMSMKAVRCALKNLESTGEIHRDSDHLASIITVQKYDAFQNATAEGYIKLPRWHPGWDWFENLRASMLYLHLILSAAYADTGTLKRGQVFTQLSALSAVTGQTERAVRTDLSILEQAGLIQNSSTNRGRLLSITYYDLFQGQISTEQAAGKVTGALDEKRQAEPENSSGTRAQQVTGQLCFTNRLDKPFVELSESDRGTPFDRQKGTPDVEKGHTDCHSRGTHKGTPSIIEENKEAKNGRRGEECAQARPAPCSNTQSVLSKPGQSEPAAPDIALSADKIGRLYQQLCPSLPPLSLPLTVHQRHIVAVLATELRTPEAIHRLFQKAGQSAFLNGQVNDGVGWQADFDWIIALKHARRILAGAYDKLWDKSGSSAGVYLPAASTAPSYDMDDYVKMSMQRLIGGG